MNSKNLFIYDSIKLFEILNEIKENFNFEINHISKKEYQKLNFDEYTNYLIVSTNISEKISNCLVIDNLPQQINKIVEKINLSFLKNQFNNQSEIKIGKYILDLNSRKIYLEKISLNLTEKESDLILYIHSNKNVSLRELQKKVWGYSTDLETHTVETHIYRLRKKISDKFMDENFILNNKDGYYL